jgi:DNA-binding IclR family transcriptional regulator
VVPTYRVRTRVIVAAALSEHLALRGRSPTLDELAAATGLPRRTVHTALVRLRGRGLVTWEPGRKGTLRFPRPGVRG